MTMDRLGTARVHTVHLSHGGSTSKPEYMWTDESMTPLRAARVVRTCKNRVLSRQPVYLTHIYACARPADDFFVTVVRLIGRRSFYPIVGSGHEVGVTVNPHPAKNLGNLSQECAIIAGLASEDVNVGVTGKYRS